MPNDNISSSFPETRRDVGQLKQTAVDAAKDLASTASTHVNKARGQVQDLASAAREYVLARPLTCLGVALAAGILFGLTRRGSRD
jgi:ElaB/YqjD/DUF883 family membrane-anchored ribosome-binding protein